MSEWRKSSFSGAGNDCVEIRNDLKGLRDTKDRGREMLTVDVRALKGWVIDNA